MYQLDSSCFDKVQPEAASSPRRRMHYDLRTQAMDEDSAWRDSPQRMQNVMMKWRMELSSLKLKTGRMTPLKQMSSCKF